MPDPQQQPHGSPDLPDALKKQIAEVDAMYNPPADQPAGASAVAPPEGGAPSAAPPAAQPQEPPASHGQPPEDDQTWEQRAKSAQGRIDQMLAANKALSDRVTELQNGMAALQARGLQPPPAPAPAAARAAPSYVKPEEVQEYGEEFIDIVGRRAKEVYAPEFDELSDRLKRLEGQVQGVGQVVTTTVKRTMYETLDHDVPNWKDINRSPEFKAWLQNADPYSGIQRHQLLTSAYNGHETGRVVSFFKGFLTEAAGLPTNPPGNGSAPPLASPANGQGNGSGKPSLEDFAAPGRARSAPQPTPPEKPFYSQASIAKFYADKLAGKFRGREAEVAQVEADIFQAQHEGRIQ